MAAGRKERRIWGIGAAAGIAEGKAYVLDRRKTKFSKRYIPATQVKREIKRVQTAIEMNEVAEPFIRRRAIRHLEKGRVVLFAGGTGNPFFTTDSAAALRANEIAAEVLMKATKVDGVYTSDPVADKNARLIPRLSYDEVLQRGLKVMDAAAIALCMESEIPIQIFNIGVPGIMIQVVQGENVGSWVGPKEAV